MSIKSSASVERRRKPEIVRQEALAIGKTLLIQGGLGALTLKAIGAEMGMTHANLIHHFGSAEAFQNQLKGLMVEELTRNVTALIRQHESGAADLAAVVDTVFGAYAAGGIGMLVAWSAITKSDHETDGLRQALGELMSVLERLLEGPDAGGRARLMVVLVSLLALGDSLIGEPLAKSLGGEARDMRRLTVRMLEQLRAPEDAPALTA